MANNLGVFSRNIRLSAHQMPFAINSMVKDLVKTVVNGCIDGTPVDTAEARSNWLVSLGSPVTSVIPPYVAYPKFSKGNGAAIAETANAQAAKARAAALIAVRQPGQTVFIQNNVDHIGELNAGSSKQAPALFVDIAVLNGIKSLDGKTLTF